MVRSSSQAWKLFAEGEIKDIILGTKRNERETLRGK